MEFGARLRTLRAIAGMSQSRLSDAAQIDRCIISLMESGRIIPGQEVADRIRTALGWTAEVDAALDALAEALGCEEQAIEQGRAG